MRSFKQILERSNTLRDVNLGKEYSFFYRGKWIIDTFHKLDREAQRGTDPKANDLFQKAIDWLLKNNKKKGVYLFVSKLSKLGMVVDYRQDKEKKVKGNHLIIITWLGKINKPPKDIFTKHKSDIKIILEYYKNLNINEIVYVE